MACPRLGTHLIFTLEAVLQIICKRQEEIQTEALAQGMQVRTTGKEPRYLRIQVEPKGSETSKDEVVNIRIPIKILKTGVALSAYLPEHAKAKVNEALKERGFNLGVLGTLWQYM